MNISKKFEDCLRKKLLNKLKTNEDKVKAHINNSNMAPRHLLMEKS